LDDRPQLGIMARMPTVQPISPGRVRLGQQPDQDPQPGRPCARRDRRPPAPTATHWFSVGLVVGVTKLLQP
jgi:hypothetical protein